MDEILWCYQSNETSSAVLSHGNIYLAFRSNFSVCGWNPASTYGTIYLLRGSNSYAWGRNSMCDHSIETSLAVLSYDAICF